MSRSLPKLLSRIRGSCMVEAVLVLPFAMFLGLGTVEIGRAVHTHITLSRAAYEAGRYAASFPGLTLESHNTACDPDSDPGCSHAMAELRNRINLLLSISGLPTQPDTLITTTVRDEPAPLAARVVDVELHTPFRLVTIIPGLNLYTVTSKVTAPYLFPVNH